MLLEHLQQAAMLPGVRALVPLPIQHLNGIPVSLSMVLARELVSDRNPTGVLRELRHARVLSSITHDVPVDQVNMPRRERISVFGPKPSRLLPEIWLERLLVCLHRGMSPNEITSAHLQFPSGSLELCQAISSANSGVPQISPIRRHSTFLALARER